MIKKIRLLIISIIILLIILAIFLIEKSKPSFENTSQTSELKDGKYPKSPELAGINGYINAEDNLTIKSLKGKVILIDFWTYTCINCLRTLPYLKSWHEKYSDKGLVIIGVHTPEFSFEKDYANVLNAVKELGIKYPVVQDNDYVTWTAFKNRYWPRKYLIDSEGYIRYDHVGEGAYKETEIKIQELLKEKGEKIIEIPKSDPFNLESLNLFSRTPELYAGYDFSLGRGQNIGNSQGLQPDKIIDYTLPANLEKDKIYLEGKWKSNPDNLESLSESSIYLKFTGSEVNIVTGPLTQPQEIKIIIDGSSKKLLISEPKLYNLYSGKQTTSLLQIKVSNGFNFNAFTFG